MLDVFFLVTRNLYFFLSFFIYPAIDIKAYKLNISGQDRKAARAALITALNTSKTHVI